MSAEEEELTRLVEFVVGDAQDVWTQILGADYRRARLVLFRGAVQSGCGYAEAAMGPFYCPADEKVYIDLDFYDELRTRFGAPGDFAQAYVIAHEIGHHVQHLLGIEGDMRRASQQQPGRANALSVALELQADCALPTCGATAPLSGTSWSAVTWRRASAPRPRWVTTGCSGRRRGR